MSLPDDNLEYDVDELHERLFKRGVEVGKLTRENAELREQIVRLKSERAAAVIVTCRVAEGVRVLPKQNTELAVGLLVRHYANHISKAELDRVGKAAFDSGTSAR